MMHKLFFITLFSCVATSDKESYTFDPRETILADCIKHYIVIIDGQYKSTKIVNDTAYFAAERFHGKSMSKESFSRRYKDFFFNVRNDKFIYEMSKDERLEGLKNIIKQALIHCANKNPQSSIDTTILEKENPRKVITQDNDRVYFSLNKDELSKCIESHLKLTGRPELGSEDGFTKEIAELSAKRFCGKFLFKKEFHIRVKKFFYDLRRQNIHHLMEVTKLSSHVESLIEQTLEDCSMDKLPLSAVPTFEQEPIETAQLLNLILVKWPENIHNMIQSRNGRKLLRRYATNALAAFLREFNVCQNNSEIFRVTLRSYWRHRAREMYNANSAELPYIEHRYTLNYPSPHMVLSSFFNFIDRQSMNFSVRNPLVPIPYLHRILNIHRPDGTCDRTISSIFDDYIINGMTHAEYYLENQINQMYRIIFFFLELRSRGICTDGDDIFDGPLPDDLIPEQIQAIMENDDIYRNYLLDEKFFYKVLMGNDTHNEIVRNLLENSRVLEENLILLRSNIPSTSGILSNIESASAASTTSVKTQSLKRKSNVWKNKIGKCFPKRKKISSLIDDHDKMNQSLNSEKWDQVTNLTLQKNPELDTSKEQYENETNDNHGYIISTDDDFEQIQFYYEELLDFNNKPC